MPFYFIFGKNKDMMPVFGGVAEWTMAAVLKTAIS